MQDSFCPGMFLAQCAKCLCCRPALELLELQCPFPKAKRATQGTGPRKSVFPILCAEGLHGAYEQRTLKQVSLIKKEYGPCERFLLTPRAPLSTSEM
ncbi:hypothetical protein MUG91_G353n1 [Manis pentadactyla]|nr:hypothetical protein MUG91_G353n1 [Manis pentadactyla]